jgi:MFS family permease
LQNAHRTAYLGCSLAIGVFSAFNNFTLSLWLTGFTSSYVLISLLGNGRSFLGTIVSPLAGAWSDRVWLGWLGRRRPFILGAGLGSALLLAVTPWVTSWELPGLGQPDRPIVLAVVAILLFTITFNLMDDIHKALLADLVEGDERNALSALSTVVNIGSQVGLLVLGYFVWSDGVPDWSFGLAAGLMAVGLLVTVFGLREPPPAVYAAERQVEAAVEGVGASWRTHPRHYRGAAIFCLVNFAYWSGVNAVMPLVAIYTRDILGATVGEAQLLPALLFLSTAALAIPMGWLGSRFGKRRMLSLGYTIMGLAALAGLVITTREQGAALFLLAGVGNSATIVLAIPLLADLVPRHHMGTAAGLLAASGSLAAPLASVAAGALAEQFGPRAIFAVMAAMTAVAVLLIPFIHPPPELIGASRQQQASTGQPVPRS